MIESCEKLRITHCCQKPGFMINVKKLHADRFLKVTEDIHVRILDCIGQTYNIKVCEMLNSESTNILEEEEQ